MACDPQTFSGITPQVWTYMQSEARRQLGVVISGESGQASERGFRIGWLYDPAAQALTITCIEKPMLVPCIMINGQIAKLVEQARAAVV